MKQKKVNFNKEEQAPVILDGITLKHAKLSNGAIATFVEISGKDLDEQIDFGSTKIDTGKDENGYDVKYQIRFTASCNMNIQALTEGFYKLISNNMWIDTREDKIEQRILRVGQVEKFECYFEFTKEEK